MDTFSKTPARHRVTNVGLSPEEHPVFLCFALLPIRVQSRAVTLAVHLSRCWQHPVMPINCAGSVQGGQLVNSRLCRGKRRPLGQGPSASPAGLCHGKTAVQKAHWLCGGVKGEEHLSRWQFQVWILVWVYCSTEREILSLSAGTYLLVNKKQCSKQRWWTVTEKFRNWVESFILPWSQLPIMSVGSDFFRLMVGVHSYKHATVHWSHPQGTVDLSLMLSDLFIKEYTYKRSVVLCYLERSETWSQCIRQNRREFSSFCPSKWSDF